jgi:hypothetical protein
MEPIKSTDGIIDFCLAPLSLAPLSLDGGSESEREVRRRMTHVIRTLQAKLAGPVAVDFSNMPSQVINEAAHGYE